MPKGKKKKSKKKASKMPPAMLAGMKGKWMRR